MIVIFCWEKLDSGELQAYWTSDFPEEELKQYVEKSTKRKKR